LLHEPLQQSSSVVQAPVPSTQMQMPVQMPAQQAVGFAWQLSPKARQLEQNPPLQKGSLQHSAARKHASPDGMQVADRHVWLSQ